MSNYYARYFAGLILATLFYYGLGASWFSFLFFAWGFIWPASMHFPALVEKSKTNRYRFSSLRLLVSVETSARRLCQQMRLNSLGERHLFSFLFVIVLRLYLGDGHLLGWLLGALAFEGLFTGPLKNQAGLAFKSHTDDL